MKIDLHMHSTASDGTLTPSSVMELCHDCSVGIAALTDHDTTAGLDEARAAAKQKGIYFVPGVEMSCLWGGKTIHVVGLGLSDDRDELEELMAATRNKRDKRAYEVADKFASLGIHGMYEKALAFSHGRSTLARPHFARALLAAGIVKNMQEAFDKYLGDGKICYVPTPWPPLRQVVAAILLARGLPVLAHPGRYKFANPWQLDALVKEFASCEGKGIEVVSGSQPTAFTAQCLAWAQQFHLYASTGSDFHSMGGDRPLPGEQGELPPQAESIVSLL